MLTRVRVIQFFICNMVGEKNEYGWVCSGHAALIMDNLIAEGKSKPFIIAMTYGMTNEVRMGGMASFDIKPFETVLVEDWFPTWMQTFARSRINRIGLWLGFPWQHGNQNNTLKHLDKFSHIGLFSGATITLDDVEKTLDSKRKLNWFS